MPYLALKELYYHGRTYPAGASLPDAVRRWPELRHCQRRGFVSKTSVALPTPAAEPAPAEPQAAELVPEPVATEPARRESRKPRR